MGARGRKSDLQIYIDGFAITSLRTSFWTSSLALASNVKKVLPASDDL